MAFRSSSQTSDRFGVAVRSGLMLSRTQDRAQSRYVPSEDPNKSAHQGAEPYADAPCVPDPMSGNVNHVNMVNKSDMAIADPRSCFGASVRAFSATVLAEFSLKTEPPKTSIGLKIGMCKTSTSCSRFGGGPKRHSTRARVFLGCGKHGFWRASFGRFG